MGGLNGGLLRAALDEQAWIGLGEDAQADQALEPVPGTLDVLRLEREVQGLAQVAGTHRSGSVGEDVEDLLVGRQDRRLLGWLRGHAAGGRGCCCPC